MKNLKNIHQEIKIDADAHQTWAALSKYGDVSKFHAGVMKSYPETGNDNQASLGCERICEIKDMGLHITLKERIIDYKEGDSYKYEVYEWKNFPLRQMFFTFKIIHATQTRTILALDIDYKAKPAFLTPIMAGKMNRLAKSILLGYKHYVETHEMRAPINQLKSKYKSDDFTGSQYDYS